MQIIWLYGMSSGAIEQAVAVMSFTAGRSAEARRALAS